MAKVYVEDTPEGWYKHRMEQWRMLGRTGPEPEHPMMTKMRTHEISGEEDEVFTRENYHNLIDFLARNGRIFQHLRRPIILDEPFVQARMNGSPDRG